MGEEALLAFEFFLKEKNLFTFLDNFEAYGAQNYMCYIQSGNVFWFRGYIRFFLQTCIETLKNDST